MGTTSVARKIEVEPIFLAHFGAIAASGTLAVGACISCAGGGRILPLLGLVASLTAFGLRLSSQSVPRLREWADLAVVLLMLAGCATLALASATGTSPCNICILYWLFNTTLFIELIFSKRNLAFMGSVSIAIGAVAATVIGGSAVPRSEIAFLLPPPSSVIGGPKVGDSLGSLPELPQNGILVFATQCGPCWQEPVIRKVRQLKARGLRIYTIAPPDARWPQHTLNISLITLDPADWRRLHLEPAGVPHIVQVRDGTVVASGDALSFQEVAGLHLTKEKTP
jgi:hypothetical protein